MFFCLRCLLICTKTCTQKHREIGNKLLGHRIVYTGIIKIWMAEQTQSSFCGRSYYSFSQSSSFLSWLRRQKKWVEWPKLLLREFPNFVLKSAQPEDKPGLTLVGSREMKEGIREDAVPFYKGFLQTFSLFLFSSYFRRGRQ